MACIAIPDEMLRAVEEVIALHPEYAYADVNEFVRDSVRTSLMTLDI